MISLDTENDYFDKIYKSLKTYNILDKTIFLGQIIPK